MDWQSLGKKVAQAAPVLGGALGPGGAAIGGIVASVFGAENTPDAINQALETDPQSALKLREIEAENRRELTRYHLEAETERLTQINKTMRVESKSEDPYVRRWRPTFGYIVGISFGLLILGIVFLFFAAPFMDTKKLAATAELAVSLGPVLMALFSVGLTVLGVNITRRSQDKQVAAGQQPSPGMFDMLAQGIKGLKSG